MLSQILSEFTIVSEQNCDFFLWIYIFNKLYAIEEIYSCDPWNLL